MIACPFKEPVKTLVAFGGVDVPTLRFEQRAGLVFSRYRFSAEEAVGDWPFQSFSQFVFVIRGAATLNLPDIGSQSIAAGSWFALSLGSWPASSHFNGEVELLVFECSQSIWRSLASEHDALQHTQRACFSCSQREEPVFLRNRIEARERSVLMALRSLTGSTPSERLMIEARTLEALALVSQAPSLSAPPAAEPCLRQEEQDALDSVATYLEENIAANHTLTEISRKARINEFKLKKGFRDRYRTTVFGYLRQKRMERASELLSEGQATVLEVAQAVGYSNPSHFSRAFREAFGVNPKAYSSANRR